MLAKKWMKQLKVGKKRFLIKILKISEINESGQKLKNFVQIRPLMEINTETIADLLKMMQLENTQSDTFMERDLKEAKKKLDNSMKLPKDIEDGMKKSLLRS